MSNLTERIREGAQALLEKAADLQERIRERAQAIWEREGRPEGRHEDHWREAEKEVAAEARAEKKPTASKPRKATAKAARTPTRATSGGPKEPASLADAATAKEVADDAGKGKRRRSTRAPSTTTGKPRRAAASKEGA